MIAACTIISYLVTFCYLENGSTYFAYRISDDQLNVYIDNDLAQVIYKNKVVWKH